MSEYREKLIDRMIALYGYENRHVIYFARLCEDPNNSDSALAVFVENHERTPDRAEP